MVSVVVADTGVVCDGVVSFTDTGFCVDGNVGVCGVTLMAGRTVASGTRVGALGNVGIVACTLGMTGGVDDSAATGLAGIPDGTAGANVPACEPTGVLGGTNAGIMGAVLGVAVMIGMTGGIEGGVMVGMTGGIDGGAMLGVEAATGTVVPNCISPVTSAGRVDGTSVTTRVFVLGIRVANTSLPFIGRMLAIVAEGVEVETDEGVAVIGPISARTDFTIV